MKLFVCFFYGRAATRVILQITLEIVFRLLNYFFCPKSGEKSKQSKLLAEYI